MSDAITCKLCGGSATAMEQTIHRDDVRWFVACDDREGCAIDGPYGPTHDEAVEKWNRMRFEPREVTL